MTQLILRRYKKEDIEQCIVQTQAFLIEQRKGKYQNHYKELDLDTEKMYNGLVSRLNDPDFFLNIITADKEIVGGLCGYIASPMFSNHRIAYDQMFYITPKFKNLKAVMKLIQSYIYWAEQRDAVECRLCSSTGFNQQGFTKLCQRNNFTQFEVGFVRKF